MEGSILRGAVDDLVLLDVISEEQIIETLGKRYSKERIYTFIGPVLISMNPYKNLDIYSPQNIQDYQGRYPYELPPHVFAIAEDAYRLLVQEGEDQSIIISGESGSGKTENSKKILEYISAVCGSSKASERADFVKKIFIESNPLLEAFGNAKTSRNDNSSRFGKYMEMQFDYSGIPIGGRISNYLLEKSRVLRQGNEERNFHIFYQLLTGASVEEIELLKLNLNGEGASEFKYLNRGGCITIKGIDDRKNFQHTKSAMKCIGMSDDEQQTLFGIVAAILHLGNISVSKGSTDSSAKFSDTQKPMISHIAKLLGTPLEALERVLCYRTVTASKGRGSNYQVPLNVEQCTYTIDAFAKGLYERLFQWIVRRVNSVIELQEHGFIIGVLDIYGFEIFEVNSFEQLCINYVNEKLQEVFIELTLKAEQEEYANEGIQWEDINYNNNARCVELIEKKPLGIFAFLEEECLVSYGEDKNFLKKIEDHLRSNSHLIVQTQSEKVKSKAAEGFTIKHYAGNVTYDAVGFLDKNKDTFYRDLKEVLLISEIRMIQDLVSDRERKSTVTGNETVTGVSSVADRRRPLTAATTFQNEVTALMKRLYSCTPHYIRCIKPNSRKQAILFDTSLVSEQVRYLGLLENVRVRRAGFAYRQTFEKFINRYKMLTKATWPKWSGTPKDVCLSILHSIFPESEKPSSGNEPQPYQFGKTKLFIRHPNWIYTLEELRMRKLDDIAKKIQSCYRSFAIRKYFLELRAFSLDLFQDKKERRRRSVDQVFFGDYLSLSSHNRTKSLLKKFGDQKVLFSDVVRKVTEGLKAQERALLISDKALYNLNPKRYSFKRRFEIKNITGLTISTLCDGFIIVHAKEPDYDYLAESEKSTEIITVLCDLFSRIMNSVLPLNFSDKAVFRSRKGNREIIFQKAPGKNTLTKKGHTLYVGVDSSDVASPGDFAKIMEYVKLKKAHMIPKVKPLIIRKQKRRALSSMKL